MSDRKSPDFTFMVEKAKTNKLVRICLNYLKFVNFLDDNKWERGFYLAMSLSKLKLKNCFLTTAQFVLKLLIQYQHNRICWSLLIFIFKNQILDLCQGNYDLFMNRRRPDNVEIHQIKMKAREEKTLKMVWLSLSSFNFFSYFTFSFKWLFIFFVMGGLTVNWNKLLINYF